MNKFNKILVGLVCLVLVFSASTGALAADPKDCECATDLGKLTAVKVFKEQNKILPSQCIVASDKDCGGKIKIFGNKLEASCSKVPPTSAADKAAKNGVATCTEHETKWQIQNKAMMDEGKKIAESSSKETSVGESQIGNLIQKCGKGVTFDKWDDDCKDITVFVSLLLQLTNYLFGIIGALALGAFIYGGFVLILSQGNPEKVKQGTGAMINALIGLLIAFGGYVLVSFLGEVLGLKDAFSLLK